MLISIDRRTRTPSINARFYVFYSVSRAVSGPISLLPLLHRSTTVFRFFYPARFRILRFSRSAVQFFFGPVKARSSAHQRNEVDPASGRSAVVIDCRLSRGDVVTALMRMLT